MAANSLSPSDDGRLPDGESMRGCPIFDRAKAIEMIRREQDDLAVMVMFLADELLDGSEPLDHDCLRQEIASQGRRALLYREAALVSLGGDAYEEPPEWDWNEILDSVTRDNDIADLERAFQDCDSEEDD